IEVSDISVAGLTHRGLLIRQVEHPRNRVVYTVTISLDPKCYGIFTDTKDLRVRHRAGQLVFAERPQDAPMVHFGGPLTLHVGSGERFRRGGDSGEVSFWLGTPGLGPGTFAVMDHDLIPKGVRPVVEIQFPAKEKGQQPVGWKYALQAC